MGVMSWLGRVHGFLCIGQWNMQLSSQPKGRRRALFWLRVFTLAIVEFLRDKCVLRAAGLTLVMLFSLAPAMAVGFAVAKGYGLQEEVRPVIYRQFGVGPQADLENPAVESIRRTLDSIISYVEGTSVQALGLVGFLVVLYLAFRAMYSIERTLNDIWNVRKQRRPIQRLVDYLAVLFVLPLMLILSVLISAFLESPAVLHTVERWIPGLVAALLGRAATFVLAGLGLWFLYYYFPNTRVSVRAAGVGAFIAAFLWLLLQYAFVRLQVGVANYNAIYGTFAAIPIFLLWIQFTWVVVLLGAEISYAYVHQGDHEFGGLSFRLNDIRREEVALGIVSMVGRAYLTEQPAPTVAAMCRSLRVPMGAATEVIASLIRGHVLAEVTTEENELAYVPAAPMDKITLGRVLHSVHRGAEDAGPTGEPVEALGVSEFLRMRDAAQERFNETPLLEFVHKTLDRTPESAITPPVK